MSNLNEANHESQGNADDGGNQRHRVTMRIVFAHLLIVITFFVATFYWGKF